MGFRFSHINNTTSRKSTRRCSDGYKKLPSRCIGTLSAIFLIGSVITVVVVRTAMLVTKQVEKEVMVLARNQYTEK